ncbi:hypothetical protein M5K25_027372 [Dendrobium thyrsiflorum]|uniref:tRNA-binding domain-containing protein n=1 Tax=Dendrobium thyrsiflorum TaxID=117978 RepID=A0ABD0TZU4_DENTH
MAAAAAVTAKGGAVLLSASVLSVSRRLLPSCRSNIISLVTGSKTSLHRRISIFTSGRSCHSLSPAAVTGEASSTSVVVESTDEAPNLAHDDPVKEAADVLDIRVGRILRAWRHPEADSLYVEEVDVGEAEPRTICSGLVNYVPLDHLQDIKVVVLANLKPRNMRGIKSNGMLMAASDAPHVTIELLLPPEDSVPGERIWFGSEEDKDKQSDAATPNQVQKKKIWELVQPHLKTTDECVAVLGVLPMRTSAGLITCRSLKNSNIS